MKPKILYIGFDGDNPITINKEDPQDLGCTYVRILDILKYLPVEVENELLNCREYQVGTIIDTEFGKAKVIGFDEEFAHELTDPCEKCIFNGSDCCNSIACLNEERADQTDVYFEKVD